MKTKSKMKKNTLQLVTRNTKAHHKKLTNGVADRFEKLMGRG